MRIIASKYKNEGITSTYVGAIVIIDRVIRINMKDNENKTVN